MPSKFTYGAILRWLNFRYTPCPATTKRIGIFNELFVAGKAMEIIMMDITNSRRVPVFDEFCDYVCNPVFNMFCSELCMEYTVVCKPEFSKCSWMKGWNLKIKKSGRNLCTVYPKEGCFSVMVVIGQKEKDRAEALIDECCDEVRKIYNETKERNGQRWLMFDLEDADETYRDVLRLAELRKVR